MRAARKAPIHIRHGKALLNYLSPHCPSIYLQLEIMAAANPALARTLDLASVGPFRIQLCSTLFFTRTAAPTNYNKENKLLQLRKFANPFPFKARIVDPLLVYWKSFRLQLYEPVHAVKWRSANSNFCYANWDHYIPTFRCTFRINCGL